MANPTFSFESDAYSAGTNPFTVVSFTGKEAISQIYEYVIELKVNESEEIDLDEMIENSATFVARYNNQVTPTHGVLASFDIKHTGGGYTFYSARLVPRVWRMSLYKTNEVYLGSDLPGNKSVVEIIDQVLTNTGLTSGLDYELSHLHGSYPEREYTCQFGESDLSFVSRLMEHEGIYYYFEHGSGIDKLILSDDAHYDIMSQATIGYASHEMGQKYFESIHSAVCRRRQLPAGVAVHDFNYQNTGLDVSGSADVDAGAGIGTEYLYGENFTDPSEGSRLATIRAEELLVKKTQYYAESGVCTLQVARQFKMQGHPSSAFDSKDYLVTEITHEGISLDQTHASGNTQSPHYRNSFTAIAADTQYRPERLTSKPRFYGTMTAFIYSESDTKNAEVDEYGRYRVYLPFDRAGGITDSNTTTKKASHWIRMAQPYVGEEEGTYFPLKGDTEVLLTFINGDPDRPIISSAVPNATKPSLLTDSTSHIASIQTPDVFSQRSATLHSVRQTNVVDGLDTTNRNYINEQGSMTDDLAVDGSQSMLPPWSIAGNADRYNANKIHFALYDDAFDASDLTDEQSSAYSTDRAGGDSYGYANARTFYYPQDERVYFIGTFHEDFHLRDDFVDSTKSWTGQSEVFYFPAPGGDGTQQKADGSQKTEAEINPTGKRGVTEDRRWGDQMFYHWGRIFSWSGGPGLGSGGAQQVFNYGNGYTENLLTTQAGDFVSNYPNDNHHDKYEDTNAHADFGLPEVLALPNPYASIDYTNKIDVGQASVEKTAGDTFSYQRGFSLDVKNGESHSWTYGDSKEWVDGNSMSWTKGNSRSDTLGDTQDYTFGSSNSLTFGYTNDMFLGAKTSLDVSLKLEIAVSGGASVSLGPVFEVEGAGKFGLRPVKADQEMTELKNQVTSIEQKTTKIQNVAVQLNKLAVALDKSELRVDASTMQILA